MHAGGTDFGGIDDVLDVDIAIVGAGISGLYCALRLIESDPSRRIAVVERLDRTGGRLFSGVGCGSGATGAKYCLGFLGLSQVRCHPDRA